MIDDELLQALYAWGERRAERDDIVIGPARRAERGN
jgi:hypothetical protein